MFNKVAKSLGNFPPESKESKRAKHEKIVVKIGSVDCSHSENKSICPEDLKDGAPSVQYINKGAKLLYEGAVEEDAIVQFLESKHPGILKRKDKTEEL
jgi:hypothetical protein